MILSLNVNNFSEHIQYRFQLYCWGSTPEGTLTDIHLVLLMVNTGCHAGKHIGWNRRAPHTHSYTQEQCNIGNPFTGMFLQMTGNQRETPCEECARLGLTIKLKPCCYPLCRSAAHLQRYCHVMLLLWQHQSELQTQTPNLLCRYVCVYSIHIKFLLDPVLKLHGYTQYLFQLT